MTLSILRVPSLDERASWTERTAGPPDALEVPRGRSTTYLTHGLFRYAGKLPPPLVAYLLAEHTESGDLVVDPMCGGGTTAIEASSSGRRSTNFDVNPVSRIVTEAVTGSYDGEPLAEFARAVESQATELSPPEPLREFFSDATYGVLRTGLDLADDPTQQALILSIARPASFANTKKINTVVDASKQPAPAGKLLADATDRFIQGVEDLAGCSPAPVSVEAAEAHSMPMPDGEADFVLLHPPYLSNTAFSESMHLQLLLLGTDPLAIRRTELAYRGSYFHVPNGLKKYLVGWARILDETARVLRDGGRTAVVVGDGRIDRVRIPVGAVTKEFAADRGLRLVDEAVHVLNNQTGWTLSRRMSSQHVLVFEKA